MQTQVKRQKLLMPSSSSERSLTSEPCEVTRPWFIIVEPPTSTRDAEALRSGTTDGRRLPTDQKDFGAGSASITSRLIVCCTTVRWTSTRGAAPLTVMVSATSPTFNWTLTGAVKFAGSSRFSRLTDVKPARLNVTV